jgi:signal transduction histidine kinase
MTISILPGISRDLSDPVNQAEVSGIFLLGVAHAFHDLSITTEGDFEIDTSTLRNDSWYPIQVLADTFTRISERFSNSSGILFRAGMIFLETWYERGAGKSILKSGKDWLKMNEDGLSYKSFVRGNTPDETGWCKIVKSDEEAGIAIYDHVCPLDEHFVAGLSYRGCTLFGDFDYVNVEVTSEPFLKNPLFKRLCINIKYRATAKDVGLGIVKRIEDTCQFSVSDFSESELESLLWRYKNSISYEKRQAQYFCEITEDLTATINHLTKAQDVIVRTEKMAALGGLVAGVAHEINTPVGLSYTAATHIQNIITEIENSYRSGLLDEISFEKFIDQSAGLARSMIICLEKAAKLINSFKLVAVDQAIDDQRQFFPAAYIGDILLTHHQGLQTTQVKVTLDCAPEIKVSSYPGAWSQIISNLIMNSLTHAFTQDSRDRQMSISVKLVEENIQLIFEDNGRGMDSTTAAHIFEPFFTTNRQGGGTGLGMHIVFNLVTQRLLGEISLATQEGKGAKFSILFPQSKPRNATTQDSHHRMIAELTPPRL